MVPPPSPQTTVANNPPLTKQAKLKQQLWGGGHWPGSYVSPGIRRSSKPAMDIGHCTTVIDKTGKTQAAEGEGAT